MFRNVSKKFASFPASKRGVWVGGGFLTGAIAAASTGHADEAHGYQFSTDSLDSEERVYAFKHALKNSTPEERRDLLDRQQLEDGIRAKISERSEASDLDLDERTQEYVQKRRDFWLQQLGAKTDDSNHGLVDFEAIGDLIQMRGKGLDAESFYKQFSEALDSDAAQNFMDENPDVESLEKLAKLRGWQAEDVSIEGHLKGSVEVEVDLDNERYEEYTEEEKDLWLNVRELDLPHEHQREKVLKHVAGNPDPPPEDCSDAAADLKCYDTVIRNYSGDVDDPDFQRVLENELCWPHRRALMKCAMSRYASKDE